MRKGRSEKGESLRAAKGEGFLNTLIDQALAC
jgi:hypothetical protein